MLVDLVAAISDDDDVGLSLQARGHRHGLRARGITLLNGQGLRVGHRVEQDVVGTQLVVERQVDLVVPEATRADLSAVDHLVIHRKARACRDRIGCVDGLYLQVGACLGADEQQLIIDGGVVVRACAQLEHLGTDVGGDANDPATLDARRQVDAFGAGVGLSGLQAGGVAERSQGDRPHRRIGRLEQFDGVGDQIAGVGIALVQHGPADLDVLAFGGRRRGGDGLHHQVGAGGHADRDRAGQGAVVVAVDELVGATGLDENIERAGESLGQAHLAAAVVAGARGQRAQVVEIARGHHAAAVGVRGQRDAVGPGAQIGAADAAVLDPPGHCHRAARLCAGRRAGRHHLQVGVRDRHDVHRRGAGGIVRVQAVLEHLARAVGLHEQRVAPGQAGRRQHGFRAGVGIAHREGAAVAVGAQHDVVAVAQHAVAGGDDAVHPVGGLAHAGAGVADRPAHRQPRRIADGLGGCGDGAGLQVGVRGQRHGDRRAGGVVAFGTDLVDAVAAIGLADQVPRSLGIDRQRDGVAAAVGVAGVQRGGDVADAEQPVVRVEHGVARQIKAVGPGAGECGRTGLRDVERNLNRVARSSVGHRDQPVGTQVDVAQCQGGAGEVVALALRLVHLAARIGDHQQTSGVAVGPGGQVDQQAGAVAVACRQRLGAGAAAQQRGPGQLAVGAEVDVVDPRAVGGGLAGVGHVPAHGDRGAGQCHARRGADHRAGHQVGRGRGVDLQWAGSGADVVADPAALEHQRVDIALDQHPPRADELERQREGLAHGVGVASRERAAAVDGAEHHVVTVAEHAVLRQHDTVLPAAGRGAVADVAHPPGQLDGGARQRGGRCADRLDGDVGIRCDDRDGLRHTGVVGAGVGLEHRRARVAAHDDVQRAVEIQRQRQVGLGGVRSACGQRAGIGRFGGGTVVGIAERGVGREHDAIDPVAHGRCGALVGDGPGDGDCAAAARGGGHRQVGHHQIGVGRGGRGGRDRGAVVAFGGAARVGFGDAGVAGAVGVGHHRDRQRAHAGRAIGQLEAEFTGTHATGSDRPQHRRVVEQRGIHQRLLGGGVDDDDAVGVPAAHRGVAGVDVVPAQGLCAAGEQRGWVQGQGADLQIRG